MKTLDEFTALMEVDMSAESDYSTALEGKSTNWIIPAPAIVRDFDPSTNILTYIDSTTKWFNRLKF